MPHVSSTFALRRGHTLWEMLIVLAVVGFAAALVAPVPERLRSMVGDDGAASTTRDVRDLLERARLTALERATVVSVLLDPASGDYWVFEDVEDGRRLIAAGAVARAPGVDLVADGPRVQFLFSAAGLTVGDTLLIRDRRSTTRLTVDRWLGDSHVGQR